MTTLYYSPQSCSMSVHIALEAVGESYEALNVKEMGEEFAKIHPKKSVPAMKIDDSEIMTQNTALLTYVAEKYPEANIAGDGSLMQTYEINKWLAFVGGDFHPSYHSVFGTEMFTTATDEESINAIKAAGFKLIKKQLSTLEAGLEGKEYLVGDAMTIADMYAFPVSRWYGLFMGQPMDSFPNIVAYQARMSENPIVAKVLAIHSA